MSFYLITEGTLYGPMHSKQGVEVYKAAVEDAKKQGGKIECGGNVSSTLFSSLKIDKEELSLLCITALYYGVSHGKDHMLDYHEVTYY